MRRHPETPAIFKGFQMTYKRNMFLNKLGPNRPTGFDVMHKDVAAEVLKTGRIFHTEELLKTRLPVVGDPLFLNNRLKKAMPQPFKGMVGNYVPLSVTPATRAAFATSTAHNAAAIPRSDLVVVAIDIEGLTHYGLRPLVTDRSPVTAGCVVSDDLKALQAVPWERIHERQLRRDGEDSKGYDAEVLIWHSVPLAGVARVICPDSASRRMMEARAKKCGVEIEISEDAAAFF